MKLLNKRERTQQLSENEKKWSKLLMAAGWTAWPSIILEKQDALGLSSVDINILLHLARFWWFKDNLPYPAKATIAKCMRIHATTVRRHIAAMEDLGFIRRHKRFDKSSGRQETNVYDFDGLIEKVSDFAQEALEEKERHRSEKADRRRRKKPRLSVVAGGGNQPRIGRGPGQRP